MKKAAILLALLCFIVHSAQAQRSIFQRPPKDSTPFNNRLYKQEIGIDARGLLWDRDYGSSLIWKVRDDRSKLVPVTYSKFWRFQARIQGNNSTGYADSIFLNDDFLRNNRLGPNDFSRANNNLLLLVGRERNNFYNRFNFYTGWDFGLSGGLYRINLEQLLIISDKDGPIDNYFYKFAGYTIRSLTLGAHVHGFAGVKYHFSDRVSISVEATLGFQYYLTRRSNRLKIEQVEQAVFSDVVFAHNLRSSFDYLRLFTLNYHFKKY